MARLRLWFLTLVVLTACGGDTPVSPAPPPAPPPPPAAPLPITGTPVPEMVSFDQVFEPLLRTWAIPGGAIAVSYQGRLVYARGFGYSDTLTKTPVQPNALFRLASISKPITAVAIMRLVEQGKLDLDAHAFSLLPELTEPPGTSRDGRLGGITVKQLLWHAGGWDRDLSGDPMFQNAVIASALQIPGPASARDIIRFMIGRPLDFDPGARYAYSNFGYTVLGRIIEDVSGERYDAYVKNNVLAPAGISRMQLGRSHVNEHFADEVHYYDPIRVTSVFPGEGAVWYPDGGFYLESLDSHGGWLASAVDLVKFMTAVDGLPSRPDVISQQSLTTMLAKPPALWNGSDYHYAMGWLVRPNPGNWWHNGSLPGTATFMAVVNGGITVAAVFNARQMLNVAGFEGQIDPRVGAALNGVTSWPTHDLFSQFP